MLVIAIFLIVTLISGYVSLGSILAMGSAPVLTLIVGLTLRADVLSTSSVLWQSFFVLILASISIFMHRSNIKRLLSGTENGFKKHQKEVLEADGATRSFMQEGVSSVMTLKAYGAEEKTTEKAKHYANVYYAKRMKRNVLRSSMNAVFSLLSNFGLIFAVVWCSIDVLNGNSDYGSILSVILLLMQLHKHLLNLLNMNMTPN